MIVTEKRFCPYHLEDRFLMDGYMMKERMPVKEMLNQAYAKSQFKKELEKIKIIEVELKYEVPLPKKGE